jgi:hypothetical protein
MIVRLGNEEMRVFTSDVSARGVAFKVNTGFDDWALELEITLPPEITLSASLTVRCQAKVVRVQRSAPSYIKVAASIEKYEFLKTIRRDSL